MVLNMLILNLPSETIGEEMYELLTMANQTTEDVFSLLDNLLKWTKSQIGKLKVVYQDINMVEVVEGVSEIFTMVAGLKNIKIVQDVPVADVAVRADIDMVKTVIRNLISNAIKFSNEGAEVVVSLAEEDGMAIVSVKDSGCGIDEEIRGSCFIRIRTLVPSVQIMKKVQDSDCCCVRTLLSRMVVNSGLLQRRERDLHLVSQFHYWINRI